MANTLVLGNESDQEGLARGLVELLQDSAVASALAVLSEDNTSLGGAAVSRLLNRGALLRVPGGESFSITGGRYVQHLEATNEKLRTRLEELEQQSQQEARR